MDNEKLIEAARLLKEHCSNTRCNKCVFDKGGCTLSVTLTPSGWEIPTPRRWTDADIALAKALKAFGAQRIGGRASVKFAYCIDGACYPVPSGAFANLSANEEISIDDIIAEREQA